MRDPLMIAATLEKMQAPHNNGRGISCVRTVVSTLRNGSWEEACAAATIDFDKIRSYGTEIGLFLKQQGLIPSWMSVE